VLSKIRRKDTEVISLNRRRQWPPQAINNVATTCRQSSGHSAIIGDCRSKLTSTMDLQNEKPNHQNEDEQEETYEQPTHSLLVPDFPDAAAPCFTH
jgi:hypothetical protein